MGTRDSARPSAQFSALVVFVLCCCSSVPEAWGQSQAGFLNIDCGASADSVDPVTGLKWVSDVGFIPGAVGESHRTAPSTDANYANFHETKTLRAFTDLRSKNCYVLPVTQNLTYLLRATFWYGNYDNAGKPPSFGLSLEATVVETITTTLSGLVYREVLYLSQSNVTFLCLIRDNSKSIPFISAISLKPVLNLYNKMDDLFLDQMKYMTLRNRMDFGGSTLTRFPVDLFDRLWHPEGASSSYLSNTAAPVTELGVNVSIPELYAFQPPSIVLQTAVTSTASLLSNMLPPDSPTYTSAFLVLHFAELDVSANISSRIFDIDVGDGRHSKLLNLYNASTPPAALQCVTWLFWDCTIGPSTVLTLHPSPQSLDGAILNGMEVFSVSDTRHTNTVDRDVFAIENIKEDMNLTEWTGDPCLPSPHPWVQCNATGTALTAPQVIAVNLSGYNLQGPISPSFADLSDLVSLSLDHNALTGTLPDLSSLKNLETLNLDNNKLNGSLPDWLTALPLLKTLTVQGNSFSGTIPPGLLSSSITFLFCPGNEFVGNHCPTGSSSTATSNLGAVIGATVGGLVALVILGLGVFFGCRFYRRRLSQQGGRRAGTVSLKEFGGNDGAAKHFSLQELTAATDNFKREIGRGGFGPVYHGILPDGRQVAVKVSDENARQGEREFLNEVNLLSRVHHKNLVALLGFCQEKTKQILVYEYIQNGSLQNQLHGTSMPTLTLDWKMRLNIALNAALGLDYLHSSCTPSIIHRDVKSGNILLTGLGRSVVAKLSDFGLSRTGPQQDDTHVLTDVKGTAGYLDPEYYHSQKLSLKSDVFSFGVVLLELLTGRVPIDPTLPNRDDCNLCQYVRNTLGGGGDINQILDPAVRPFRPNPEAVWRVAEIALQSVELKAVHRPTMMEVVEELRAAVAIEDAGSSSGSPYDNGFGAGGSNSTSMLSLSKASMPSPR